jgi:chromosome segregation ATPase
MARAEHSVTGLKRQRHQLESRADYMHRKRMEKLRAAKHLDGSIERNQLRLESTQRDLNHHQNRYQQTRKQIDFLSVRLDQTLDSMGQLSSDASQRLVRIYKGFITSSV